MIKIFSSTAGEEILVKTVNNWLKDNPNVYIQSFNCHTYYKTSFASEDELVHSFVINYMAINNKNTLTFSGHLFLSDIY